MMGFFKRKKKTNLKPPERRIIFLMNDGSWKQRFQIEGRPEPTFNELIADAQNMFKERYVGAYDHYTFFLEDETTLEIISKFSYEEVWDMWISMGKPNEIWGARVPHNKEGFTLFIIGGMLFQFGNGPYLGTGNVEMDSKLAHDYVLNNLARSGDIKNKKELFNLFSTIEGIMKRYSLPENEVENFNKIINSMK